MLYPRGRLANDLAWTIPIVLDTDEQTALKAKEAGDVLLQNPDGVGVAVLHVEETYTFDKEKTAQGVYGTTDSSHPGVAKTLSMKDYLIGGKIDYIQRPNETEIRKIDLLQFKQEKHLLKQDGKPFVLFKQKSSSCGT